MVGLSSAPRAGDVLDGRFRIDGLLGQGGFGAVYAATQLNLQRRVALKVIRPDLIATDESRVRFRREAEMAQRLEHPNTVRLFDFGGDAGGTPYMAFELLSGRGLDSIVAHEGPQAETRVARMASQVLKSLMEAHGKGIVHRDIKPSNIFLCDFPGEPDFVKVLDFGIAKPTQGAGSQVTSDGQVLGSPSYMSPEQVRGEPVGPASDLYSLGLVMAEMLSGQIVYRGPSAVQVLIAQASEDPVPLPARVTSSPLAQVIARATRKRAGDRFASAEEMLWSLETALRMASDHPAAFGATLPLGTSPVADSMPFASTYAQPTPPHASPPVLAHGVTPGSLPGVPSATTTAAATIASPGVESTTIPLSKPRIGWIVAAVIVGTSMMAGLAGGVAVFFMQQDTQPQTASPSQSGRIDLGESNPFNRGTGFKNIDAAKVRERAVRAGWSVPSEPSTNIEGPYTTINLVLVKGEKSALVTLHMADDDRIADALAGSMGDQRDIAMRRDGTAVLIVAVPGDEQAAKALLAAIAGSE